jgi:hypothetical protein
VSVTDTGFILVRDSNEPDMTIALSPTDWTNFTAGIKAGEFDDLTVSP